MSGLGDLLWRRCKGRFALVAFAHQGLLILLVLLAAKPFVHGRQLADPTIPVSDVLLLGDFSSSNAIQFVQRAAVTSNNPAKETISVSADTHLHSPTVSTETTETNHFKITLAAARYLENTRQPEKAEPMLVGLLTEDVPDSVQKTALFELGSVVRQENDLPRAQTIYAQFLERWPSDIKIPEVLLHQGEIFRQMGLNDLALGKFYSVMTSALALKNDQFAYYQTLVLQTQVEIAETHYLMGQFADAADFYSRLLLNTDPALNRPQIQFRLIRSLSIIGHNDEAVGQSQDFISRFPNADQVPEVHYYLAEALKALGRNNESLQQVLLCLQEQKVKTQDDPETWAYWQQRVGNEIGNQLYREGDYVKALEVYLSLAQLDSSPKWQIPVDYQLGMTYEKLLQPQKAIDSYNEILARETEVGTNATPGLKAMFDMARWRVGFVKWQSKAEAVDHSLAESAVATIDSTNFQTKFKQ